MAAGGGAAPAPVPVERPGLRLLRVVGSQYNATVAMEELVKKAEAKVTVRRGGGGESGLLY